MASREPSRRVTNVSTITSNVRPGAFARASVRPGVRAPAPLRHQRNASVAPRIERAGAVSPAESLSSVATSATTGTKRKERDFEVDGGEDTNINVVVRCRGRNQREVRENSTVVVLTEGVKGKLVELSMGPAALSNKTYNFDRVFSPAADQSMVFDDVVKPILEEMLTGYNCTIFAYGQTGTGKTYTMSGDMSESMGLLSDEAGIIPRVLQSLFNKLEIDETDSCVKCSFIELYNEELRDLLSADDAAKLKIFDDNTRKGHATTVVQGVEERHITNAADGIKRLQEGSVRRQVAATKCNDLSSRSHTVFTITVHIKRTLENGEDYLCTGKLNLVDLAGSENIQRSGAENKRAAEAGLINKSLLTLGRVINALVDRTSHVPYRESKLTRLLQDSLGGRTKTCIIATISTARSNLEETISTLDYAFRAKNIRNKPQVNQLINKKMLLREFTTEIERLKSELIATRQRNGVYLSNEAYEDMTAQNESRRILTEEQGAKIETMENNLRNKVQELFDLTSSFMGLKKEHEGTKMQLDESKEVIDQTELVLASTRKMLAEETHIRKAHQQTEEKLAALGGELITAVQKAVGDVDGMRAKSHRKSDLQSLNKSTWEVSQAQVAEVTELVEGRVEEFRKSQHNHISTISERMLEFMQGERKELSSAQALIDESLSKFAASHTDLLAQQNRSKEEMDEVLEEIKTVRDQVKQRVGESLQVISSAAEKIAADVLSELTTFHSQLHMSYSSLGKDLKSTFEELLKQISSQKVESNRLRRAVEQTSEKTAQMNAAVAAQIQQFVDEERGQRTEERQQLLAQISSLVNAQAEAQEARLVTKAAVIQSNVLESGQYLNAGIRVYSQNMDQWNQDEDGLVEGVVKSRDVLKSQLKDDWTNANAHSTSIQQTTKAVHAETVRVVDQQMKDLDTQMHDLDDFVTRARAENSQHLERHSSSMRALSSTVDASFSDMASRLKGTFARVTGLGNDVEAGVTGLRQNIEPLDEKLGQPLNKLREDVSNTALREYEPTGETPEKAQYHYPTDLPRTEAHEVLLAGQADTPTPTKSVPVIFNDLDTSEQAKSPRMDFGRNPLSMSLREVNPNLTTGSIMFDPSASTMSLQQDNTMPLFRKSTRLPKKHTKSRTVVTMEGRENMPPSAFSQSISRRKSPRLH